MTARADRHPSWNAGRLMSSHGFAKIRVGRGHPLADPNGYAYEHLVVWVAAGKTRPRRGQVLTHLNGVKTDNRLDNLELVSRAEMNRRKNERVLRDPRGRLLSSAATNAVKRGATIRFHYSDTEKGPV